MKTWTVDVTELIDCECNETNRVCITTPNFVTSKDVIKAIDYADKLLSKEDDECHYIHGDICRNTSSLMNEVCLGNGWTWEYSNPDIYFTIC